MDGILIVAVPADFKHTDQNKLNPCIFVFATPNLIPEQTHLLFSHACLTLPYTVQSPLQAHRHCSHTGDSLIQWLAREPPLGQDNTLTCHIIPLTPIASGFSKETR